MNDDYFVRYGNENGIIGRTDYMSLGEAKEKYNNFEKSSGNCDITWAELIYEPLKK